MKAKVYGIPNCGSVKKSKDWLTTQEIAYDFHDYKKVGIDQVSLERWCKEFGWEKVLNKKGLTWRGLPESVKSEITNQAAAIKLMLDNTSVIKRPVIESAKANLIGFDEQEYHKLL